MKKVLLTICFTGLATFVLGQSINRSRSNIVLPDQPMKDSLKVISMDYEKVGRFKLDSIPPHKNKKENYPSASPRLRRVPLVNHKAQIIKTANQPNQK